jgi:hypothetical protein
MNEIKNKSGDDSKGVEIHVTAYSGYKANERPLYFMLGSKRLNVKKILDRWFGQEHDTFKILADDGQEYLLKWHRFLDKWSLAKHGKGP